MPQATKTTPSGPSETLAGALPKMGNLIYCDRIAGVAMGPSVSRISLAMDTKTTASPNGFEVTDTLVVPTAAFLQFIAHTVKVLQADGVFKAMQDHLAASIQQFNDASVITPRRDD